ncbi:unnamed protein product [Lepeophtheirus salmonis]|uniref:(salmon louse) hypothetical protein n=1 Tax=Lepeophtheirus salmonis TaxID=72036 RepID=A0A7R8CRU1_LEPSM|nr:unnamed protein product [Lepeophtheirus salmonis]CAF2871078.1 unnamed protein product [Lepeophtheirus salmonis]
MRVTTEKKSEINHTSTNHVICEELVKYLPSIDNSSESYTPEKEPLLNNLSEVHNIDEAILSKRNKADKDQSLEQEVPLEDIDVSLTSIDNKLASSSKSEIKNTLQLIGSELEGVTNGKLIRPKEPAKPHIMDEVVMYSRTRSGSISKRTA